MLFDIEVMIDRRDLSEQRAFDLMTTLIENGTDLEKTVFLLAAHMKGLSGQELTGFANAVRSRSNLSPIAETTDIVGTGGDGRNTINVSTAAAILCAGMGIRIAKHGNRAITSPQGSADIMESMNYRFERKREELEEFIGRTGFAFLLAPYYNSSFARFFPARKLLTFKTVMNYMGPVTNPADPEYLVVGSSDSQVLNLYADYLRIRGKRGYVVHGEDGMDEISPVAPTRIIEVNGRKSSYSINPDQFGISGVGYADVSSSDPTENRRMMLAGLFGVDSKVAAFIALNAAPALVLNSFAGELEEGYALATKAIAGGVGKQSYLKISGGSAKNA